MAKDMSHTSDHDKPVLNPHNYPSFRALESSCFSLMITSLVGMSRQFIL